MKEFKTLGYDWECGHEDLIIRVLSYADRKRLYIGLYKEENGEWEDFGNLTVNCSSLKSISWEKFYLKQPYQDTALFRR